jgi:phage terminase large subunit-like protein
MEKKQELEARRLEFKNGLPHLFGFPWYSWAKAFFDSINKMNLLVAANQISKSSTQIRKCIHWATETKLWPRLWPTVPRIFWYLYPSKEVATVEFEKKWVPEFLPQGVFKDDPKYGWDVEYQGKFIHCIHFRSGVTVYFRTYAQDISSLQSQTVAALFADEELPEDIYNEINMRLAACDGYFHMVFTATLNQEMWRRAMEGVGDAELFPDAFKQTVSMYDCLTYLDGTPGHFTEARIKRIEATCQSDTEVQRRVHGKFVTELGRKYASFNPAKHYVKPFPIPFDWKTYEGVDVGSGGQNHPGALCFIAVRPDCQKGYVFHGRRVDGVITTAGDILDAHNALLNELPARHRPTLKCADPRAKDFHTLAERAGEPFQRAETSHEFGEATVNTLFKSDMLYLFDTPEIRKLGSELVGLQKSTPKEKAKDDFCDGLRYASMLVPWDWSAVKSRPEDDEQGEDDGLAQRKKTLTEEELLADQIRQRRGEDEPSEGDPSWEGFDEEIDDLNAAYG